jgi:dTDP-4-amino-4,6-dideoxygalactose transaminase
MNRLYTSPKTFRALAPAGNFPGPISILSASSPIAQTKDSQDKQQCADFSDELCKFFKCASVSLFGSGRLALYHLFLALKENEAVQTVTLSSFTCPDVAAAAVRAGLKLELLNVNERTLDVMPLEDSLSSGGRLVLLSNLYGLADEVSIWRKEGNIVIDDACQSSLSICRGTRVGGRGDFGVCSFGRGKAISGLGGGGLLLGENSRYPTVFESLVSNRAEHERQAAFVTFIRACVYWLLEHPELYWILARIPSLGLGSTEYDEDFAFSDINSCHLRAASVQLSKSGQISSMFISKALEWHNAIRGSVVEPFIERGHHLNKTVVPTRYPVVFASQAQRDEAYRRMAEKGLGASMSYDYCLQDFAGIQPHLVNASNACESSIARRVLTLPVHRFVRAADIEKGAQIILSVSNKAMSS